MFLFLKVKYQVLILYSNIFILKDIHWLIQSDQLSYCDVQLLIFIHKQMNIRITSEVKGEVRGLSLPVVVFQHKAAQSPTKSSPDSEVRLCSAYLFPTLLHLTHHLFPPLSHCTTNTWSKQQVKSDLLTNSSTRTRTNRINNSFFPAVIRTLWYCLLCDLSASMLCCWHSYIHSVL